MRISHLDHLVLTVTDLDETVQFYTHVLGMEVVVFGNGRKALHFGNQKINLHLAGHEFEPKANRPSAGSADLCFAVSTEMGALVTHLVSCGVEIEEGPVKRTGAVGVIQSVYLRDPDDNLIELGVYDQ